MTDTQNKYAELLEKWLAESGPVALHLRQRLLPVEADENGHGIVFPPTFADIGYIIDKLADGTCVAILDTVGSQANRMEPIFKRSPYKELVPQIEIVLYRGNKNKNQPAAPNHVEKRSLLDLAHRSADSVVLSCPGLAEQIQNAFRELHQTGNAVPLATIAPTSLVFGVWDSRGDSNEKRPRLVRSIIRAWDVEELHTSAQFNSVKKLLSDEQKKELEEFAKKEKVKLSEKGFDDAPAGRVRGGVLVRGAIERTVTVNLVALRNTHGRDEAETKALQKYLLGLSLLVAGEDIELFLREGCLLRCADARDTWWEVPRRGEPVKIDEFPAPGDLLAYAQEAVQPFRKNWPTELEYEFNVNEAKKLLKKNSDDSKDKSAQS